MYGPVVVTPAAAAVYSPGWGARVELGAGQARIRDRLAASIRHPSRTWHDAPTMRDYGRSSSTAHRTVHRLAALGVIALQSTLGRAGGVRFTFGVRFWRRSPIRRAGVARIVAGQVGAFDEPRRRAPTRRNRAQIFPKVFPSRPNRRARRASGRRSASSCGVTGSTSTSRSGARRRGARDGSERSDRAHPSSGRPTPRAGPLGAGPATV